MKDYVLINNYSRLGRLGISRNAIASVASYAVETFAGVAVSKKKALFSIERGVKVSLTREGKAIVKIDIDVSVDAPVQTLATAIQKEVASAIALSCDTVPLEVQVRVAKIS